MCFQKNYCEKLVIFTSNNQDRDPNEKLGSQIHEQVDRVMRTKLFLAPDQVLVLKTRSWSGQTYPKTAQCLMKNLYFNNISLIVLVVFLVVYL